MKWDSYTNAPAVGTQLATLEGLSEGQPTGFSFGEGKDAFHGILVKLGHEVRAFVNRCPHYAVPLNREGAAFYLLPQNKVMCVVHCAVFSLEDGKCVDGPVKGDHLASIPVAITRDGSVVISE